MQIRGVLYCYLDYKHFGLIFLLVDQVRKKKENFLYFGSVIFFLKSSWLKSNKYKNAER